MRNKNCCTKLSVFWASTQLSSALLNISNVKKWNSNRVEFKNDTWIEFIKRLMQTQNKYLHSFRKCILFCTTRSYSVNCSKYYCFLLISFCLFDRRISLPVRSLHSVLVVFFSLAWKKKNGKKLVFLIMSSFLEF